MCRSIWTRFAVSVYLNSPTFSEVRSLCNKTGGKPLWPGFSGWLARSVAASSTLTGMISGTKTSTCSVLSVVTRSIRKRVPLSTIGKDEALSTIGNKIFSMIGMKPPCSLPIRSARLSIWQIESSFSVPVREGSKTSCASIFRVRESFP